MVATPIICPKRHIIPYRRRLAAKFEATACTNYGVTFFDAIHLPKECGWPVCLRALWKDYGAPEYNALSFEDPRGQVALRVFNL